MTVNRFVHLLFIALRSCCGGGEEFDKPTAATTTAKVFYQKQSLWPQRRNEIDQLTVHVDAGRHDCYYVPNITANHEVELSFSVLYASAATGKNDIIIRFIDPKGNVIFKSEAESEGSFSTYDLDNGIQENGTYELCLDNGMSTISNKWVYFELDLMDASDEDEDSNELTDLSIEDSDEVKQIKQRSEDYPTVFDMKVNDVRKKILKIYRYVGLVKHDQDLLGKHFIRDTHQVLNIQNRIDVWAGIHLVMVFFVGLLQVFILRQFFEDKSVLSSGCKNIKLPSPQDLINPSRNVIYT